LIAAQHIRIDNPGPNDNSVNRPPHIFRDVSHGDAP